ncbi:MAG: GGDEF domain-containing protein [Alphaproteobacteria bacterium]|nr:GGDEF domain-containing protein [Alphaproteobacteria bacterium]
MARKAWAIDLSTGLPNRAQLLEHMGHLLALREREPAPMALIVLRVSGLGAVGAAMGSEAANVLRRKAAVRLRAALRASDVVAAIGADAYAVLLAWIDAPTDGERVAAKLAHALARPFKVAGREQTLVVSQGLASYPEHGREADALLRRALAQASASAGVGQMRPARAADRGLAAAANDDEAKP